jgi:hypothetical protein
VEHGREVTPDGDNHRQFLATGELNFARRTCFVLTETGVGFARAILMPAESPSRTSPTAQDRSPQDADGNGRVVAARPHWDAERHELRMGDRLV